MGETPHAFKVSAIEQTRILTILVDSINARNAHWVKDEVLSFLQSDTHSGILLNLYNVRHMGHIGLGALIAMNTQLKKRPIHAFIGVQTEVLQLIHASHLETIFHIWEPGQGCPICHQKNCVHQALLADKIREFPVSKYPIDERNIPHLGETASYPVTQEYTGLSPNSPAYQMGEAIYAEAQRRKQITQMILASIMGAVLLGGGGVIGYFATQREVKYQQNLPLTKTELIKRYDKNGDNLVDQQDIDLMDPAEKLALSYSPWCKQLGLPCGLNIKPDKGK